jgi:hypothetical protein
VSGVCDVLWCVLCGGGVKKGGEAEESGRGSSTGNEQADGDRCSRQRVDGMLQGWKKRGNRRVNTPRPRPAFFKLIACYLPFALLLLPRSSIFHSDLHPTASTTPRSPTAQMFGER